MKITSFLIACICFLGCHAQNEQPGDRPHIGGPCEGCLAVYEYGDRQLLSVDTMPGFEDYEPRLRISGIIRRQDGSPAPDVVLYLYQTDRNGIYKPSADAAAWERRHGQYRAWVKTDADGAYTFYTFRPASYPNSTIPAHIHATILEPGKNPYYIDDFVFEDDPYLPEAGEMARPRCGSGRLQLERRGDLWIAQREIVLGANIPNYW